MKIKRTSECFNKNWHFCLTENLSEEITQHGNTAILEGEVKRWQKAGNFGISNPDNPHIENWPTVDLPHDYVIEGEFTPEASTVHGSLKHGIAWYVKKFQLPDTDKDKRIFLEFDGVYRDSQVMVNGHFIGRHLSGYTSFSYDITEVIECGEINCVAVYVDASENELWSYEGGGIYREVRLVKSAQVFIPQWGTYITTGDADNPGEVNIETTVSNKQYSDIDCIVRYEILTPDNKTCLLTETSTISIDAMSSETIPISTNLIEPKLWQLDDPKQYTLITSIFIKDIEIDRLETKFGFRYFHFDAKTGFSLNDQNMKLKGTCIHQDHAGVGVAVPPKLQEWRIRQLKDMGCNAIRTSHNPPDPALLNACDRLGMLVMNEIRVPGIAKEFLDQAESLVRRDRNHPSVIMWSLGNEEMKIQHLPVGSRILGRVNHLVKKLDPSRPTTYACNGMWINSCDVMSEEGFMVDVFGSNYRSGQCSEHYDNFHNKHPDWPHVGSETCCAAKTRGLYEPDKTNYPLKLQEHCYDNEKIWLHKKHEGYASAYGGTYPGWAYSVEETWIDCVKRPYLAGTFFWTGFDYRGETFPYEWPSVVTRFGLLDLCGFYKEQAHYLRSWWRPDEPHIFLMPHWDWHGHEGEEIDVWCYSNATEVELILNGQSLGRKEMPENFRLEWEVPYQAGKIEAIGYNKKGEKISSTYQRTTSRPVQIEMNTIHEETLSDSNEGILVINASIRDNNGDVCPKADHQVDFQIEGPLEILGLGNGNPMSLEADKGTTKRKAYHGWCQAILQTNGKSGKATITATSPGLSSSTLTIEVPVT